MNKVLLVGNVSRNPETHTTQGGVKNATFGLAVNRRYTNAQGNREADFFNIVVWRERAEFVEKYVTKGKKLCVVGSLQNRTYETQDGNRRNITEIIAEELEFVSAKNDEKHGEQITAGTPPMRSDLTPADDEEGLPF